MSKQLKKKKPVMEYRYYEIPSGEYVLPLLGKGWEQEYGVGYENMLHFHNYLEIGYCYHGDGIVRIDDRTYAYQGDMFTILPENVPHVTISSEGNICKWEYLFIDLEDFLEREVHSDRMSREEILSAIRKISTLKTKEHHPVLAGLILSIIRECREQQPYMRDCVKGYLYALVFELMRLGEERGQMQQSQKANKYLEEAISYIDQHYMEELKVEDLAARCGLSESHFRRIFEESMNMKPIEYLNLVRIRQACRLIQKEQLPIAEISRRVGYQTASTFNRNFRKLVGMTPHQWKTNADTNGHILADFKISAQKGWRFD